MKNIDRRFLLKGAFGAALSLPALEIMGEEALEQDKTARRFCGIYTANGMGLPGGEWNWYPEKTGRRFEFNKSTKPLEPFRDKLSFFGGFHHPNGPLADPHVCSDMWLTGAPLHNPKPGTYNTVSLDQVIAAHTKKYCRQPSLVLSIDAGVGYASRTSTLSYNYSGKPIPAENKPQNVFNRLFKSGQNVTQRRQQLKRRMKLVDAVLEDSHRFNKKLGRSDREKMDQYITSLSEVESRLQASEKWIDIPLKKQDHSGLNLNVNAEIHPSKFYQVMFDLIALAFDADITRTVTFTLNREDGMGISDTFPLKLGLKYSHHNLSHKARGRGMEEFAKYDLFLSEQLAYFAQKLSSFKEGESTVLDNTICLYGSGASDTHNTKNLPHMIIGGGNMGLSHGTYFRKENERLSNLHLSILKAMKINENSFSDSTGPLMNSIFTYS